MIRRFWYWLFGESPTLHLINELIANQQEQSIKMMEAVSTVVSASQKQAEVLHSYLELFKSPGEPQRWAYDMEEDNKRELSAKGFPIEGTEAEQAQWILDNLDQL